MDPDLTAYATALLTGTGTSTDKLTDLITTDQDPTDTASAAVMDGWRAAHEGGEHT